MANSGPAMAKVSTAATLSRYSEVDWGPVAAGYVGIVGIGALLLAAGILASALSRSQLVAAVLTFAIAGPLFAIGFLEFLALHHYLHFLAASERAARNRNSAETDT